MIVAKICGGLGNQMFQYAAGYALSKLHKTQLYLDLHELAHDSLRDYSLGVFNIGASVASDEQITSLTKYKVSKFGNKLDKIVSKIGFRYYRNYYRERYFSYDSEFLRLPDDVLIDGYWQSEKYFSTCRDELLSKFKITDGLSGDAHAMLEDIINCKDVTVSIHVRRGDYISDSTANKVHGTCSVEYYENAMNFIEARYQNIKYVLFSDDIEWVLSNLKIHRPYMVVSSENIADYEDMMLMSSCDHQIIANSSFSWWGAWLNPNKEKIVISPEKWFSSGDKDTADLIPLEWIKL